MNSCCTKVTLHKGQSTGRIELLCGFKCYITSNYSPEATKFLFIFTDIFGIEFINNQLVADTFSSCLGYPVIMMDILNNDPFVADSSITLQSWFSNHPHELTNSIIESFFQKFKTSHKTTFLAGVGYCFGAKYLADYLTKDSILNAGAFAHPSLLTEDVIENISKPLLISCAEEDKSFNDEFRKNTKEILQRNKVHYQIDLFSNTTHGFAVRGDFSIPIVKYAAEKALTDHVLWFKYHDMMNK